MNINGVYFVNIYVVTEAKRMKDGLWSYEGDFVKNTLVVKKDNISSIFTDLQTKEEYKFESDYCYEGDLYINKSDGLIPLYDMLPIKKQNMSKRKVLKKFNEYKDQVIKKQKEVFVNINGVYFAKIYIIKKSTLLEDGIRDVESGFVKNTLVTCEGYSSYIDLETNEKYSYGSVSAAVGEMHISSDFDLIPYSYMISTKKQNMGKKKILKRYRKYKEDKEQRYG